MERRRLTGLLLATFTLLGAGPRPAASGRVVDRSGSAVAGAKACLVVTGADDLCAVTDEQGRYALPASEALSVRVGARGFLPVSVAAVPQESPVVLEQAAALRVHVVDSATGRGLDASRVRLVYSNGRQFGPLPANRAGLALATLPAGEVRLLAAADGYRETSGAPVTLVAGREIEITLKLTRAPAAPAAK